MAFRTQGSWGYLVGESYCGAEERAWPFLQLLVLLAHVLGQSAHCLPTVCAALAHLQLPPDPSQGSLHGSLSPALHLLSSPPLPEVRLGPGWTLWAGLWASVSCMALNLTCPRWMVPAILCLRARTVSKPAIPQQQPAGVGV